MIAQHTIPPIRMVQRHLLTLVVLCVLCASHVTAHARQDDVQTIEPGITRIQRSDLLRAFLRFERRWAQADQTPQQMRRFEHIFEGTARATFRNDVPAMLAVRDRAAAILACSESPTLDWRLAASLRVSINPPVLVLEPPGGARGNRDTAPGSPCAAAGIRATCAPRNRQHRASRVR